MESEWTTLPEVSTNVRTIRIIIVMICAAAGGFLGFAIYSAGGLPGNNPTGMLTKIALGISGLEILLSLVVPRVIAQNIIQRAAGMEVPLLERTKQPGGIDANMLQTLNQAFLLKSILHGALLESASFLGSVAYWQERNWPALVSTALPTLLIPTAFPLLGGVQRWFDQRIMEFRALREMQSMK